MDAYQTEDTNIFTNSGTIDIGFANSNGIELDGGFTNSLDNSGTITIGASGDYNGIELYGQSSNYNSVNLLTNSGTIDIGYGCNGIAMQYSDNTLNNSGSITISGTNDDAIYMYGYSSDPKSDQSLINSGTLDIVYANGAGIYMYYGQDDLIDNSGTITIDQVKGAGIEMYAYNSATLTNSGTISIGYSNSNGIEVDGADGTVGNLTNTGEITINDAMDNGLYVNTDLEAVLTNSGTITIGAANSNGIEIYANDTDSKAEFYNQAGGTITVGTTYYQYLEMYGYDNTFDNAGTINFTTFADEEGIVIYSYNSATFNNSGTLDIVNAQDEGIEFRYGGDVTFTNSGVITIDTNMDDDGILFSSGDDTLTNTGTINIARTSTGIEMGAGDDTLTTSGALNFVDVNDEVLDGGSGIDTLNLQGTDALAIEGDIINFEFLNKTEAGTWTLNGDVDAYNSVSVAAGTLIVNGDLDAYLNGVTVDAGATFGGDADIDGDVVVDGTIAPGNSIGTIYIDNADYYQNDGALYEVEVGSFEQSDLIIVSTGEVGGTAYLDDGALVDVTSVGYVADGDIFTILIADDIPVFYNSAGLSYSSIVLDYEYVDDGDDTVKLAATRTAYEDLGVGSNGAGAGGALIELAENGNLDAGELLGLIDNSDNLGDLEAGLGSLAPEMYPSLLDINFLNAYKTALLGYLGGQHVAGNFKSQMYADSNAMTASGPALSRLTSFDRRGEGLSGWARVVGQFGTQDKDSDLQGFEFDTYGLSVGVDSKVSSNLVLGVGFGMAQSDVDFDNYSQTSDVDSYFGSLYGSYSTGNLYVDAALSYAGNDYDSDRNLVALDLTASSSTDGSELGLYVGGGLSLVDTDTMYFIPTASLSWAQVDIDGFTEEGAGAFNLEVDDYDADSLVATIGFRWGGKMGMMEPELRLAWAHEFGDTDRDVSARFEGTTTTFEIEGVEPESDSALLGLGANFFVNDNCTIYLDYDGEFRSDFDAHSVSGGLRYNF
jgi:outer membrane autotransporter protein